MDDLNGNREITLKDLITKDIKKILDEKRNELKLDDEFKKVLTNFIKREFKENDGVSDYINEILNYMDKNDIIKEKIIEIAYKLIEDNKDKDEDHMNIIEQIYKNKYVNKYRVDIISCSIIFIKDNIFYKYLFYILQTLEDDNCLTTLLEVERQNSLNKEIVEKIMIKILNNITINEYHKKSKFLYNYSIPGFYNFLSTMSDFINKNIILNYSNNEKKIRLLKNEDLVQLKNFHETENNCLGIVCDEFVTNHKLIFDIIKEITEVPNNLIFGDYITFYLQKYYDHFSFYKNDDI